jgi:hypothetical protein
MARKHQPATSNDLIAFIQDVAADNIFTCMICLGFRGTLPQLIYHSRLTHTGLRTRPRRVQECDNCRVRFPCYVNLHRQYLYAALHEKRCLLAFLVLLAMEIELRKAGWL